MSTTRTRHGNSLTQRQCAALLQAGLYDVLTLEAAVRQALWSRTGADIFGLKPIDRQLVSELGTLAETIALGVQDLGERADTRCRSVAAGATLSAGEHRHTADQQLQAVAAMLVTFQNLIAASCDTALFLGIDDAGYILSRVRARADQQLWTLETHLMSTYVPAAVQETTLH